MEWKPIESAPRDGTRVLVFAPLKTSGKASKRLSPNPVVVAHFMDRWGWLSIPSQFSLLPTHWMPLPPPQTGEKI